MSTLSIINTYFANILNRAPIGDEAATWVNLVDRGVQTLDQVRSSFVNSPEVQSRVSPVVQIYIAELGRTPDQTGLAYWVAQEDAGLSLAQIGTDIAGSTESQANYGTTVDEPFLNKLYQNALGRAPEPGVVANWIASGLTTTQIVAFFATSPEASARDFAAVNRFLDSADRVGNSILSNSPAAPTFALSTDTPLVNDGATVVVTLATTGISEGTPVAYTISGVTGDELAGGSLTGTFVVNAAGGGSVPLTLLADNTAKADETLTITLDDAPAVSADVTVHDTTPSFALTAPASAADGSTVLVTLETTNVAVGSTYQYKITGVAPADLVGGVLTGAFTVDASGKAVVALVLAPNVPPETLTLELLNGGASTDVAVTGNQTIKLTSGLDTGPAFVGGAGNDTFIADQTNVLDLPIPAWGPGDTIDGGGGTNTLNIIQNTAVDNPLGTSATNIQLANVIAGDSVALDARGWASLTKLNVRDVGETDLSVGTSAVTLTTTSAAGNNVTIRGGTTIDATVTGTTTGGLITLGTGFAAPTGPVTLTTTEVTNSRQTSTADTISVTGGSIVDINVNLSNPANTNTTQTAGTISVTGTADTTSVSAIRTAVATASPTVAGVQSNSIDVTDVNGGSAAAGTITSITAANFTTLGISDNALTTLNITGGSGNIIIDNSGLDTPTNKTLDLTIAGETGGTLDDADIYTTLNITTANANSTLANITEGALTALTIAGDQFLTLVSTAGLTALKTVTVSGSAGVSGAGGNSADFSGATVTSVDTSATTGNSTVTLDASKATFTGGDGVENVTANNTVSHAILLGDGDDSLTLAGGSTPTAAISGGAGTDTLSLDASSAATDSAAPGFADLVTGFERLVLRGATNQTVDLANLGLTTNVTTHGGNGLQLNNLSDGGTLTLDGAGTAYTITHTLPVAPPADAELRLVLSSDASISGTSFAATGITTAGIGTIAITVVDTSVAPAGLSNDTVTLLGNQASIITVRGNSGLVLTAIDTAARTINASQIGLGGFSFTSGALANAAAIKGSATGTNTVDFSAALGVVTYTGGSGNDAIIASNGKDNVISLGEGNNSVTGTGVGNQTITAGAGDDTVILTAGDNSVDLGDGTNSFTATTGDNSYIGGSGNDTVTLGGGSNNVDLGDGINSVVVGAGANLTIADHTGLASDNVSVGAATTATVAPGAIITGLSLDGQDTITFSGDSTAAGFTQFSPVNPLDLGAAVGQLLSGIGGNLADHGIGAFEFGGNTYLVEQNNGQGAAFAAGDTLVELTGGLSLGGTNVASGLLHLLPTSP